MFADQVGLELGDAVGGAAVELTQPAHKRIDVGTRCALVVEPIGQQQLFGR